MIKALNIFLNEVLVGQITLLPGDASLFTFDDSYVESPLPPILSQSFISSFGELKTQFNPVRTRLHPFFSNLLPEGHLRDYLAAKNNINTKREFPLLEALGADLPGAITAYPADNVRPPSEISVPIAPQETGLMPYRFSLAGVQLKFSALKKPLGGLTIPASGVGGNVIIKLPSLNFEQVPENEYTIMTLARRIGIDVPLCDLVALDQIEGLPPLGLLHGKQALAIQRFDRGPNHVKIHMEDFAQVYGIYPEDKYDHASYTTLAKTTWTLCNTVDTVEYIRRLAFSILVGNGDMHLKNWSLIYPDGRTPRLSPAYDLLSTIPYIPSDTMALNLGRVKEMQLCTLNVFDHMAKKAGIAQPLVRDTVMQTVMATRDAWSDLKKEAPISAQLIDIIDRHMASIPL